MNTKPLSYDSLKVVLRHMEANKRFTISQCIPSIRLAEKAVPLNIEKLESTFRSLRINDKLYIVGVYRDYAEDAEIPVWHQRNNQVGGTYHDLDQYGFGINTKGDEQEVTPGDLVIREQVFPRGWQPVDLRPNEVEEQRLGNELRIAKWVKARMLGRLVPPIQNVDDEDSQLVFDELEDFDVEDVQEYIDNRVWEYLPYYHRRNNIPLPYTKKIQLTIFNSDEVPLQIWRRPEDMRCSEVRKRLMNTLLGGRPCLIHVKNLKIGSAGIHGFPMNLRLKVRELNTYDNQSAICDALQPIVDNSSYPLEVFETTRHRNYELNHPVLTTAKKLVFHRIHMNFEWLPQFLQLPNRIIHMDEDRFTVEDHITIIRNWKEVRRDIGTCYTLIIGWEATITRIFALIREELNGEDAGERHIKIPLTDSSDIDVSYVQNAPLVDHEQPLYNGMIKWTLTIQVVPK